MGIFEITICDSKRWAWRFQNLFKHETIYASTSQLVAGVSDLRAKVELLEARCEENLCSVNDLSEDVIAMATLAAALKAEDFLGIATSF